MPSRVGDGLRFNSSATLGGARVTASAALCCWCCCCFCLHIATAAAAGTAAYFWSWSFRLCLCCRSVLVLPQVASVAAGCFCCCRLLLLQQQLLLLHIAGVAALIFQCCAFGVLHSIIGKYTRADTPCSAVFLFISIARHLQPPRLVACHVSPCHVTAVVSRHRSHAIPCHGSHSMSRQSDRVMLPLSCRVMSRQSCRAMSQQSLRFVSPQSGHVMSRRSRHVAAIMSCGGSQAMPCCGNHICTAVIPCHQGSHVVSCHGDDVDISVSNVMSRQSDHATRQSYYGMPCRGISIGVDIDNHR